MKTDNGLHRLVYEYYEARIQYGFYSYGDRLPSIPQICGIFQMAPATVRSALALLEKEGYLTRMPNPECRRSYLVALTQAGYEKADEVKVGFSRLEEKMCAGLTEEEGETLLALLKKVQKQRL